MDDDTGEIPSPSKPKPIHIDSPYSVVKRIITDSVISKETAVIQDRRVINRVSVKCVTVIDKFKLIENLKSANIQFFSYNEKSENTSIFQLNGPTGYTCTELAAALEEEGVKPSKVTLRFRENDERPPTYLVHFEKNKIDLATIRHSVKRIDYVVVSWDYSIELIAEHPNASVVKAGATPTDFATAWLAATNALDPIHQSTALVKNTVNCPSQLLQLQRRSRLEFLRMSITRQLRATTRASTIHLPAADSSSYCTSSTTNCSKTTTQTHPTTEFLPA